MKTIFGEGGIRHSITEVTRISEKLNRIAEQFILEGTSCPMTYAQAGALRVGYPGPCPSSL